MLLRGYMPQGKLVNWLQPAGVYHTSARERMKKMECGFTKEQKGGGKRPR